MTSIAQAFMNVPQNRNGKDKITSAPETAIFQLQTIPTSARMVKGRHNSSNVDVWRAERANEATTVTEAPGVSTIADRSALPYLLGGITNLGSTSPNRPSYSRAATSRISSRAANCAEATTTAIPILPPLSSQSTRAPSTARVRTTTQNAASLALSDPMEISGRKPDHGLGACAPNCASCLKLRNEVTHFERLHPEVAVGGDNDMDRDTPFSDVPSPPPPPARNASTLKASAGRGQESLSPTSAAAIDAAAVDLTNPLSGLLSCAELYVIQREYQVFLEQVAAQARMPKDARTQPNSPQISTNAGTVAKVGLTIEDFRVLLQRVVPHIEVSLPYALRMFEPFAVPTVPPRAPFRSIFAFLCRMNGSAVVEKNVRFFFSCLDDRSQGKLSSRILCKHVVLAWAENRVIGKAIYAWRDVAKAFDSSRSTAMWIPPSTVTNPAPPGFVPGETLVSIDDVRAAVYSSQALTEAFQKPLECVLTDVPRYPLKALPPVGLKLSFRRGSQQLSERSASPLSRGTGSFKKEGSFRLAAH